MTALKRRKVGKTKLEVTELGLGGAPMGGFRATIPNAEAVKLTDDGYDAGIRYFDTSPYYGATKSETVASSAACVCVGAVVVKPYSSPDITGL